MKLSTAFSSGKVKSMFHTISDRGPALICALERASAQGKSLNVKSIISRYTLDVTSSVAFGIEVNTLGEENLEFVKIGREVFEAFEMGIKDIFMSLFPKHAAMLKMRYFNQNIEDFFFKVIGGSIEYREKENVQRNDFLNLLIQLKNGNQLTMKECIAQGFMFYTAGSDTSSTAISYCLMELGRDQRVQEQLRREINEKIAEFDGTLKYECVQDMSYLTKVVNGNKENK
jgi:cytochrome P450 family 6